MSRLGTAFRAFWRALTDNDSATAIESALQSGPARLTEGAPAEAATKPVPQPEPAPPQQNPAITLLSALQREARFVDFLQESLDGFPDAQVGAVARDVHRDAASVIKRFFAIEPLDTQHSEGAAVNVPADFDPACYRLTGEVAQTADVKGILQHHGWRATRCELPQWSGSEAALLVVAPAEVEVTS